MPQKSFSALAIIVFHKELTDKIFLVDVANEFVLQKQLGKNIFAVNLLKKICKISLCIISDSVPVDRL